MKRARRQQVSTFIIPDSGRRLADYLASQRITLAATLRELEIENCKVKNES
jgi:hypothetical protein